MKIKRTYSARNRFTIVLLVTLMFAAACKRSGNDQTRILPGVTQPVRISSGEMDAAEPAIAAAPDGGAYIVWVDHGPKSQADVMIARLTNEGKKAGSPVRVNSQTGTATAWRGDPPTIAVASDGTIYVGWTARVETESGHGTDLYLSSSRDQGRTFASPVKVNDDARPAVHGMHSLAIGNDGQIYMAWLDERNIAPVETKDMKMDPSAKGHHMESNRELFFASSNDGGRTFTRNQRVATDVCPCCKTSIAISTDNRVYLSWRQVLPGDFRHIAVTSSKDQGKTFGVTKIVSDDQWVIPGCPVSGSAISAGNKGNLLTLWYSAGKNGQTGLYWSESSDHGNSFPSRNLVAAGETRGTPVLINHKDGSFAVWEAGQSNSPRIFLVALSADKPAQSSFVADGALPAASETDRGLVIAYIAKGAQHQEIQVVSARA